MPRSYVLIVGLYVLLGIVSAQEIIVQPGDTLWDIAKRYDTTVQALKETNGLQSERLQLGDALLLPSNSTASPESYIVQTGDTLYDISVSYKISVDKLIAINNIDGTTIKPGQVLKLSTAQEPPAPLIVEVKTGDTLWSLAREYDSSVSDIMGLNNLNSESIRPGDKIIIPGRFAAVQDVDFGGAVPVSLEVSKGDTLSEIAARYNTSVTALMSANDLSGSRIKAGQVLRIVPRNELAVAVEPEESFDPIPTFGADIIWPLDGQITSRFGYRRLRIGGSNFHTGLDIDGVTGDPIYAAASGIVSFSGWRAGYGNLVILTSGTTEYYYAHASELLVTEGEVVGGGHVIAKVGSTGRSTGSHLHFEIRVDGQAIDPLSVLEQQTASQ